MQSVFVRLVPTRPNIRYNIIIVSWFSAILNRISSFVLLFKPLVFRRNCYGHLSCQISSESDKKCTTNFLHTRD